MLALVCAQVLKSFLGQAIAWHRESEVIEYQTALADLTFHRVGHVLPARTSYGRWALRAIVSDSHAREFEQAFYFWTKRDASAWRELAVAQSAPQRVAA